MCMKIVRLSSLLFAFVIAGSAFCFEFPVLAGNAGHVGQNSNSSTTTVENANAATTSRRGGRRNRRRPAATAADTSSMPAASSADGAMPADQDQTTSATTEQTDLSGTYQGTFDCADAGVTGDTTLTITGNQFTLADGKTGRILAATTRGYTGVAMQFGESTAATATQPATAPTIVSMRAKKAGNRLTLIPVAESGRVCSFTPASSSRVARTRRTRSRAATPAQPATPAEPMTTPAAPAEPATPGDEAGPVPPPAPTPGRKRGRTGAAPPAKPKPTPATPPM